MYETACLILAALLLLVGLYGFRYESRHKSRSAMYAGPVMTLAAGVALGLVGLGIL